MAQQYDFISSDTHLEVLPERWTGRVRMYRDKMPRTGRIRTGAMPSN